MAQDASKQPERSLPNILLVEDSPTTLAVIGKHLSRDYHIIMAKDGEQAWELLQQHPDIELVITDIVMPRLTGHQLLVKIRTSDDPQIRQIPVICMTSADDNVDRNLAFLNGANDFIIKPPDEMELQARVKVHYTLARTIRELELSRRALAEQANTDPLTHLQNRRGFFERAAQHLAMSRRYKTDLSVMVLDIDHFKGVNDTHGHQAGDQALVAIAELLTRMIRSMDIVARMGGEEFAILLPDTNRLGAAILAERIRAAVENAELSVEGRRIPITLSIGVATYGNETADTVDELLRVADRRLYYAKEHGRNRICVADDGRASFAE